MSILFLDLAKSVFALYDVDEHGKAALVAPKVARDKLVGMIAALPPFFVTSNAKVNPQHVMSGWTSGWAGGKCAGI